MHKLKAINDVVFAIVLVNTKKLFSLHVIQTRNNYHFNTCALPLNNGYFILLI